MLILLMRPITRNIRSS